jgi:hypothetical protein
VIPWKASANLISLSPRCGARGWSLRSALRVVFTEVALRPIISMAARFFSNTGVMSRNVLGAQIAFLNDGHRVQIRPCQRREARREIPRSQHPYPTNGLLPISPRSTSDPGNMDQFEQTGRQPVGWRSRPHGQSGAARCCCNRFGTRHRIILPDVSNSPESLCVTASAATRQAVNVERSRAFSFRVSTGVIE